MKRWTIKIEKETTIERCKEYGIIAINVESYEDYGFLMLIFTLDDGISEMSIKLDKHLAKQLVEALQQGIAHIEQKHT